MFAIHSVVLGLIFLLSQFLLMKVKFRFIVSLAILFFINSVFALKYLSRYTSFSWLIVLILTAVLCAVPFIPKQKQVFVKQKMIIPFFVIYVIFNLFLLHKVPTSSLNVDRFSVITSFWDNFLAGKYAYNAVSHMGNYPGPMPFYFILALPFYLVGELGFLSLIGILLFLSLVYKKIQSSEMGLFVAIFILPSPIFLWETISRSNIFFNSTLILAFLLYLEDSNFQKNRSLLVIGFVGGLLLSTRNVFILSYLLAFSYYFKINKIDVKKSVIIGFSLFTTFAMTFLPFVWNFSSDFRVRNPFITQSSVLLPSYFQYYFFGMCLIFTFLIKSRKDVIFYNVVTLFVTILIYALYVINEEGFEKAYFGNKIDVSYFIFCLPFALYFLLDSEKIKPNLS